MGPGKTNTFLNLIKKQNTDSLIDKIDLYAKELSEPKYEFLTKNCKDAGMKHWNVPNAFIKCSNTMDDIYEDIDDYNLNRNNKFWLFLMTCCRDYDK